MDLTKEKVTPFLPPLNTAQQVRVTAWCPVLGQLLNARYGAKITTENEPAFVSAAADAIERRLGTGSARMIAQQVTASSSVRYSDRNALAVWFLPEELAQLDSLVGMGGVSNVRMPSPDAVRFGNLARGSLEFEDDGDVPVDDPLAGAL